MFYHSNSYISKEEHVYNVFLTVHLSDKKLLRTRLTCIDFLFLHGLAAVPQRQRELHSIFCPLHGHPRLLFPVLFVEQVLLQLQDTCSINIFVSLSFETKK